jgi:hypothetical protein
MVARCHKESNKRYSDYGGKGIRVCERWRESFENFIEDMGECPDGFQIDRIDNTLGYSPDNCRWVSRKTNMRNKRNTYRWFVLGKWYESSMQAAEHIGVNSNTIVAWCAGRTVKGRYYKPKNGCFRERRYV